MSFREAGVTNNMNDASVLFKCLYKTPAFNMSKHPLFERGREHSREATPSRRACDQQATHIDSQQQVHSRSEGEHNLTQSMSMCEERFKLQWWVVFFFFFFKLQMMTILSLTESLPFPSSIAVTLEAVMWVLVIQKKWSNPKVSVMLQIKPSICPFGSFPHNCSIYSTCF